MVDTILVFVILWEKIPQVVKGFFYAIATMAYIAGMVYGSGNSF